MMRTHLLDILIFSALAYAAWAGWRRGFVLELLSTVGLLVGVVAGFMLHDVVAGLAGRYLSMPDWVLKLFAFLLTALIVFRLWLWLAKMAGKAIRLTALGMADQGLGAFMGLLKASLTISALFWLAGLLNVKTLGKELANCALAADVVRLGNAEFTLMSKATPLFIHWYKQAQGTAFKLDFVDEGE